jgi:primosomal protein N''
VENIVSSLEENLKELYRKAIDADNRLKDLKKSGHGKFAAIFKDSNLFTAESDKFMPYLEETAEQILTLKNSDKDLSDAKDDIESIVKKLHLLHKTIADLKNVLK